MYVHSLYKLLPIFTRVSLSLVKGLINHYFHIQSEPLKNRTVDIIRHVETLDSFRKIELKSYITE